MLIQTTYIYVQNFQIPGHQTQYMPSLQAIWAQLESYCDSYVAACENAALRSSRANPQESVITDGSDAAENLLGAVSEVINEHKLNQFPVCRQHQQRVSILK